MTWLEQTALGNFGGLSPFVTFKPVGERGGQIEGIRERDGPTLEQQPIALGYVRAIDDEDRDPTGRQCLYCARPCTALLRVTRNHEREIGKRVDQLVAGHRRADIEAGLRRIGRRENQM